MNTAPERDFRQHNNAEKIRLVRQNTKTCPLEDLNVGTRNGNDGFPLTLTTPCFLFINLGTISE